MYVNNKPFTETLRMAQRDIYDINTLLLAPLKKQKKNAKYKKIAWRLCAGTEHAIGITFGILAAVDIYHQNYILGVLYCGLMAIGATAGFNANTLAQSYADIEEKTNKNINNIQNIINVALPETLHEIADIARKTKQRQK